MAKPNINRVQAALAAYNREGPEPILELLDPNVEWIADRSDMGRVSYRGIEAVRRSFDQLYEGFDELGFEADELHETGNLVVAIGRMSARGRSTGITASIPLGIVFTARSDGKLVRYESFRDPKAALQAAGLAEVLSRLSPFMTPASGSAPGRLTRVSASSASGTRQMTRAHSRPADRHELGHTCLLAAGRCGSASGAPAVEVVVAQSWSPALADIVGARRLRTAAMAGSARPPSRPARRR